MAITKTLGGDRLGSGKRNKVELHGYERSTHDLGYLWRSTMSPGTLVPFMKEVALPGDTFDINLGCEIMTHPTVGPLFGSYKVQLDVFQCPIRLYQGQLHNNKLGIGMNMAAVKLPIMTLYVRPETQAPTIPDPDNAQINPSCILSYLGIRGIGSANALTEMLPRDFNALGLLGYWDIYKQYYANKQEEIGYVIHRDTSPGAQTITTIEIGGDAISQAPTTNPVGPIPFTSAWVITYTGGTPPKPENVVFSTSQGMLTLRQLMPNYSDNGTTLSGPFNGSRYNGITIYNWNYASTGIIVQTSPELVQFPLDEIDGMREAILGATQSSTPFSVNDQALRPYSLLLGQDPDAGSTYLSNQEGLGIKTYQSDLFNNWLSTEWIDGPGGITEVTAIDTTGGSFSIDTLNLSKKVYDMLNRIAVSGGSYDDWLDAVWTHERVQRAESPIYHGGLIKELAFQEVISNSASQTQSNPEQPLGTLAGRGVMANKHKGGQVTIKIDEPSLLMGIVSLTPRVDYSQGNDWDTHLLTMDDFHKPALDEIGFQELITEQMAWWTTWWDGARWNTRSAGKQPAWINYMTNINRTRGNFAIKTDEMFMTLNRRYEAAGDPVNLIGDLTTYIDPVKFNQIFAQSSIDSQNFWVQIAVDITARRKMSAKIMPNL